MTQFFPHHDNFRRRNPIASSVKNTIATPILLWSTSPLHLLQPSCHLVWSDSCYFTPNLTVSNMQILLHGSHHDPGRWELVHACWFSYGLSLNLLPTYISTPLAHWFLCCCSFLCCRGWAAHHTLVVTFCMQIRHRRNRGWVLFPLQFIHFF